MNEAEWLACNELPPLLDFLAGSSTCLLQALLVAQERVTRLSFRKQRLFLCACMRLSWADYGRRGREAIELAERYADGHAWWWQLSRARRRLEAELWAKHHDLEHSIWDYSTKVVLDNPVIDLLYGYDQLWCLRCGKENEAAAAGYLRDTAGYPKRHVALDPGLIQGNGKLIPRLAQAAYDERLLPSGRLDDTHVAILADALEDAGCTEEAVLVHLRGQGPHVRGCWVIDLLTGRK